MQVSFFEVNFYFLSRVLFKFPTCVVLKIAVHAFRTRSASLMSKSGRIDEGISILSVFHGFICVLTFNHFTYSWAVAITAAMYNMKTYIIDEDRNKENVNKSDQIYWFLIGLRT